MTKPKDNYCIILAGGSGSRLWPLSKKKKPKQFLDLFQTGQTLLQATYSRYLKIIPKKNIIISTYEKYVSQVQKQLPEIDREQIVAEPVQLGTGPSIALCATYIQARNPKANILIAPCDQLIIGEEELKQQVLQGFQFVQETPNFLALGIKATRPETNYGYIQAGEQTSEGFACVKSFTEKPNEEFARFFVKTGEFYWSTSLFVCNIKTLIEALLPTYPDIKTISELFTTGVPLEKIHHFITTHYPRNVFQSIDMIILEQHKNVFIKPCTFEWKDIGTWTDFYHISGKDANGNVFQSGHTTQYNCRNNIILIPSNQKMILENLENYLIVADKDILLMCKKDDPAQLRHMKTDAEIKYGGKIS